VLRDDHGVENRRRLRSWLRVVQPPELLYEETAEGQMRALGDPAHLRTRWSGGCSIC
jgi:hypothetical protein